MAKGLLHVSKLEEFKSWLTANGYQHRPTNAAYQVLQVKVGEIWAPVYRRDNGGREHLTVVKQLEGIALKFLHQEDDYDKCAGTAPVEVDRARRGSGRPSSGSDKNVGFVTEGLSYRSGEDIPGGGSGMDDVPF